MVHGRSLIVQIYSADFMIDVSRSVSRLAQARQPFPRRVAQCPATRGSQHVVNASADEIGREQVDGGLHPAEIDRTRRSRISHQAV